MVIRGWSPVIATCGLVLLYGLTYNTLVLCYYGVDDCAQITGIAHALNALLYQPDRGIVTVAMEGYAGRLQWTLSVGLCFLTTLLAILIAVWLVVTNGLQIPGVRARGVLLATGMSAVVAFIYIQTNQGSPGHPWRQYLHSGLRHDLALVEYLSPRLDAAGLIVAIMLAVAGTSVLLRAYRLTAFDLPQLLLLQRHTRIILYVGSAMLLATVIRASTLFAWSLSYIHRPEANGAVGQVTAYDAASRLATSMVLAQGVFYTLLLLAVYAPAVLVLRARGDAFLADTPLLAKDEIDKWHGAPSHLERAPRLLALLSPLLSGPVLEGLRALFD